MTKIALSAYTSPERSATLFAKLKILERFPNGMTRKDAESIGFNCGDDAQAPCHFSGVITQEMVGAGKANFSDGSKIRRTTLKIEIMDTSNIESLKISSTTDILG